MIPINDIELDNLAWTLEADGLSGHGGDIARVVVRARPDPTVSRVLVDVLADDSEPECARIRAFGLVAMQLHHAPLAA
jgi:hypothetical protein